MKSNTTISASHWSSTENLTGSSHLTPHPSRYDNPFATCWTRPGAMAYRFAEGASAEQLVAELAAQNWWGAIVGPHGSGKSTLLESIRPALCAAGRRVDAIALRDGQRRLPTNWWSIFWEGALLSPRNQRLIIIDGYEQLGWLERARLARRCRRANAGLLVTIHALASIPTLIRLTPDLQLVHQLVGDLTARMSTPVAPADVAASHACHGSNVREILFDLYDRHEKQRRAVRTCAIQRA